jgi:hypothetical protein
MIVKTLPILIAENKAINRPNLYHRYLQGELERQLAKLRRDLLIDGQKRFEIMERIALELYQTNKTELTSEKIREISKNILTVDQTNELDGSLREILTCLFLGADLSGADLSGAQLRGADLSRANLFGVDLRNADLRNADLRNADLEEVHGLEFIRSLEQTDLFSAKGLTKEQLKACQKRGAIITQSVTELTNSRFIRIFDEKDANQDE